MKLRVCRRITQATAVLMMFAAPVLILRGVPVLMGSFYSLSVGPLFISDPLSVLQVILCTFSVTSTLILSALVPVVTAFIFGRVFCSWVCPQNAISELFDFFAGRIGIKRALQVDPTPVPRYIVLVILLAASPLAGFPVASLISLPGIISLQAARYISDGVAGVELSLVGITIFSEFFLVRRAWCNFICPVGSLLGVFRLTRTMKVVFAEDGKHSCGRCFECKKACQFGLDPMAGRVYPLCHNCGDCIVACERASSDGRTLSFKF